jgi:hypothetical protein
VRNNIGRIQRFREVSVRNVPASNELVGSVLGVVANKRLTEVFGNLTLGYLRCNSEPFLSDAGKKNAADECVIVVAEWYSIGSGT